MHRYLLAREWCRDKDVLDVASGEGYGTALLAQVARTATGVEIAADVVAHANTSYGREGLGFVQGDARHLPLPDAAYDVVVSFETIEHFAEQDRFLDEVRRVLRPDGLLIVSTPDRDNYSLPETAPNPFHVRELTPGELDNLLRSHFRNVTSLSQRPVFGSVLLPSATGNAAPLCFERRGTSHFELSVGLARPQYIVAFATDGAASGLPASVYIDTGRLGVLSPQEADSRLRAAQAALDAERIRASEDAAKLASRLAAAEQMVQDGEQRRADAQGSADTAANQLSALRSAADAEQAHGQAELAAVTTRLAAAEQAADALRNGELRDCRDQVEAARTHAAGLAAGLDECRAALNMAQGEAKGLQVANIMAERACAVLQGEMRDLSITRGLSERAHAALRDELRDVRAAHDLARVTHEELHFAAHAQFERDRAAGQSLQAELTTRLHDLEAVLAKAHTTIRDNDAWRANILASHSWRVTAPIRRISRMIYPRP